MKTRYLIVLLLILTLSGSCSCSGSRSSDEMNKHKEELSLSPFVLETENPVARLFPQGESYATDTDGVGMYILNTADDYIYRMAMGEYYLDVMLDGEWYHIPVYGAYNSFPDVIEPGGYLYQRVRPTYDSLALPEGHYRIVVKFYYDDEKVCTYYAMEFYISD